jgi:hypothetical protein
MRRRISSKSNIHMKDIDIDAARRRRELGHGIVDMKFHWFWRPSRFGRRSSLYPPSFWPVNLP